MKSKPIYSYCECMEEIKSRAALISAVIEQKIMLGRTDFDYEFVGLHFRKILELIAFASVWGNLKEYTAEFANAHRHWHAAKILKDLEKVNENFYPVPLVAEGKDGSGIHNMAIKTTGYLTREEFSQLYDLCGSILHIPNGIKGRKSVNFIHHPKDWLAKIHELLSTHYIQLPKEGHVWLVVMNSQEDGKVHAYTAEPS